MGARILAAAHALPAQVVTNDDLSEIMETSDEWIRSRTGIGARHISKNEQTSDLSTRVAQDLLAESSLSPEQIDFIIVATISPDSLMPSTAARVQANIGADRAFAFDLSAACSGFVYALSVADKLLSSARYHYGIVIGTEVLSKFIDWSDRSTAVLFGDASGGVLVEAAEEDLILAENLRTDGKRGASLISGLTGLKSPFSETQENHPFITMDGRSVFDFAVRDVPKNINETLEQSGLSADDIDYFLLHQANSRIIDRIAKKLKIPREKFLQNMENYGNTSAASVPLLLSEEIKNGKIKCDGSQKIALTGFGGGLTWGTLIIQI